MAPSAGEPSFRFGSRLCENSNDRRQSINFSRFVGHSPPVEARRSVKVRFRWAVFRQFPSFHTAWVGLRRSRLSGRWECARIHQSADHNLDCDRRCEREDAATRSGFAPPAHLLIGALSPSAAAASGAGTGRGCPPSRMTGLGSGQRQLHTKATSQPRQFAATIAVRVCD